MRHFNSGPNIFCWPWDCGQSSNMVNRILQKSMSYLLGPISRTDLSLFWGLNPTQSDSWLNFKKNFFKIFLKFFFPRKNKIIYLPFFGHKCKEHRGGESSQPPIGSVQCVFIHSMRKKNKKGLNICNIGLYSTSLN